MRAIKIKNIMVPLAEYATVSQDASLYDAIMALEKAQAGFDRTRYTHRAILVLDHGSQVIGKLSQIDVIRGLEPGYRNAKTPPEIKHWGLGKKTIETMMKDLHLWQLPLEDICKKTSLIKVSDIMHTLAEGEFVSQDASLDEAIHQFVMGKHQSLLVVDNNRVIGILRLTDVFATLIQIISQCELPIDQTAKVDDDD